MPMNILGLLGGAAGNIRNASRPNDGRGFWGNVGQGLRDTITGSPIGQLAQGNPRGAWDATPIGGALQQAGVFQPGDGRSGFADNMRQLFGMTPNPTAMGAFGPMIAGYQGVPGTSGDTGGFGSEGTTDWGGYTNNTDMGPPAVGGGGRPGKAGGSGPGSVGAASGSGYGATGANLMGMMAMNPLRQSGITFRDQPKAN